MKKEVDFIAEFEKENSELKQEETNPSPPTEEEYRKMRLGMKLVDLKKAQYQKTKNEQLWNLWTNTFYQMMCDTARIQGGRVTLKIDEENLTGSLIYFGHDILINSYARNQKCFADMMEKAQEVFIDSIDGLLKITFLFHVYDKTKIADYSDEIKKLAAQIYSPQGSVKNFVALVKNGSFLVRITDMTILIEKEFIYGSSKRPNPTDYYRKQHYQCGGCLLPSQRQLQRYIAGASGSRDGCNSGL